MSLSKACRLMVACLVLSLLAGCGNKGPLQRPQAPAAATAAADAAQH